MNRRCQLLRTCLMAGLWAGALAATAGLAAAQEPVEQLKPDPTRITIHGEVRNSATGQPLPRALVRIEGDADTGTLTDGEGRFEIHGLPVGPQTIRVVKPGFHDRPYATEEVGYPADGPAHSVLVAAQMPDLVFTLTPNCAIHGHIQLSTGDPAEGMSVALLKRVVHYGRAVWLPDGTVRTNGDGNYRFAGLSDGVYAIYTTPSLESERAATLLAAGSRGRIARDGYPSVFYPDARDLAGAARIHISAGEQAEANFSLALEPFYPVTVTGTMPGPGNNPAPPGNSAVVLDASGHLLPHIPQYDATTHSLQADLPDGTYVMAMQVFLHGASPGEDGPILAGASRGAGAMSGSVEFTVAGHPVTGLRIPLGPSQINAVRLRFVRSDTGQTGSTATSGNAWDLVNLTLDKAEGIPPPGGDSVAMIETIPNVLQFTVQPGTYWLNAMLPRKDWCAGPLNAGGLNLAVDPLTVSLASATPPMELTLRNDCATLTLNLPQGLAAFVPGEEPFYTVYVVPDFDTTVSIPPMTIHPSSGTTLTIDGLTPGSYHVYTFDSPVHLEYRNPAVVAALANPGQTVALSAATTSSLTLEVPGP